MEPAEDAATAPGPQGPGPGDPLATPPPPETAPGVPARIVAALWLLLSVVLAVFFAQRGVTIEGDLQGLLPPEHRARTDEVILMVRAAAGAEDPGAALSAASLTLAQGLPDARLPIAPPANAVSGWLDRNGLYLMPVERHGELAQRLSPEAVRRGVAALRARLSSPLFGVSGEEARRDPLRLRSIMLRDAGMLGFVDDPGPDAPTVTGAGDLRSASGDTMLVLLRSERPIYELEAAVDALLADQAVNATCLGPAARELSARGEARRAAGRVAVAVLAGLAMLLALALRQVRPVLAIIAVLGSTLAVLALTGGPYDPLSLPLLVLLAGFGCDAALALQPIAGRRWASGLVFAGALAPLALLPYPVWTRWSALWAAGIALSWLGLRAVLPTVVHWIGGDLRWPTRGFRLLPMPRLAALICVLATGVGVWTLQSLDYRDPASLRLADPNLRAREDILRDAFFDPDLVAEIAVMGADEHDAIDRSAALSASLVTRVPAPIRRLDSPGSYVIPRATLAERRRSLHELGLSMRMQGVHDSLETQGLRAAAFSEFLRGASSIEEIPDAERALDGPLGPWIRRYLEPHPEAEGAAVLRTRIELDRNATAADLRALEQAGVEPGAISGPRVAALRDREAFKDRLGVAVVAGLWLGALLVWLGSRSLALALAAGISALATQTAVLSILRALEIAMGPHLLPALLLVGAAAIVAAGRAGRAVDLHQPLVASGILVTALCQVTAGLALVASGVTAWREMGVVITVGCALAAGLGLFVGPGLAHVLRFMAARLRPTSTAAGSAPPGPVEGGS